MEEAENIFSKIFNYISSSPSLNSVTEKETKNIQKELYQQPRQKTMNGSKAQRLHNSHRMSEQERGWFSVPQDYGWCSPSYPPAGDLSKPFYTISQPVWNINKNCLEELPVYQEQYQAMPAFPHQWVMEKVESEYCFEIIMYEKSDQRLAAEILANSRLNPNAKEFTPKTVIEMKKNCEETEEHSHADLTGHREGQGDDLTEQDYVCDIKLTDEEQSSDEEEEEDDDWDWDSDEQSTGECVIVDPTEFEDLFTPSLLVTNFSSTCHCQNNPPSTTNPRLREANKRFLQIYPDDVEDEMEMTSKTVKFSNDPTIILEPENLAEELQLARIGEFAARQADRERMERLLGPVLTETHRQKVYKNIYGQSLYE